MYREAYVGNLKYLERELEAVLGAILAPGRRPATILIFGDHGPGSRLHW